MIEGWKEQIKLSVGYDPGYWDIEEVHSELDRVYAQAAKADEYKANLNEFKEQLKIKIRHSREDGDYSEAYGFSKSLDMIENLM